MRPSLCSSSHQISHLHHCEALHSRPLAAFSQRQHRSAAAQRRSTSSSANRARSPSYQQGRHSRGHRLIIQCPRSAAADGLDAASNLADGVGVGLPFTPAGSTPLLTDLIDDEEVASVDTSAAGGPATAAAQPIKVTPELRRKAWALSSVLKVFVTKVDPNYAQPWQMCPQRSGTGSAFVIDREQRKILTNSHVVSNATAVYVRRPGSAKKFKAEVVCEGKVCDLALLTVRDDAFWAAELKTLQFVDVPELQSPIAVAGYPVGGDNISVTKGIVSRIALVRYSAAARLLSIQIDAAINPGNSGGPAFADLEQGLVAGVAFSKNVSSSTDNIGYIIPHRVVEHFLKEAAAHGAFRGVPSPGFTTQDLENPAQRAFLKVPEGASGVLVVRTDPLSGAAGVLSKGDVVTHVEGEPVADDGTVVFRDDERLEYSYLIRAKHIGEQCALKILRDGQELDLSYPLSCKDHLVPVLHGVDARPSFLIVGGLVFTPLTSPFLEVVFGGGNGRRSRRGDIPVPVLAALNQNKTRKGQQVVLLVQVLAAELNHGYRYSVVPCETFNGTRLHSVRHLAALADRATAPGSDVRYLNFGLEGGRLITLARDEVERAGPAILTTNSIAADRSPDMAEPQPPDEDWDAWAAADAAAASDTGAAVLAGGGGADSDGGEYGCSSSAEPLHGGGWHPGRDQGHRRASTSSRHHHHVRQAGGPHNSTSGGSSDSSGDSHSSSGLLQATPLMQQLYGDDMAQAAEDGGLD